MPRPGNDNIAGFMRSLGYDFTAEASAMAGDEQVTTVECVNIFVCGNAAHMACLA